jgi:hypothetical protein
LGRAASALWDADAGNSRNALNVPIETLSG